MKKIINTENAPSAIGPYSQALRVGNMLYLSGQLPVNPSTGKFAGEDIESQTKQSLENAKAILEEVGIDMSHVVKMTVFLSDISNFSKMNEVYSSYFPSDCPARSAFEVARLPMDALVEIEAIVVVE